MQTLSVRCQEQIVIFPPPHPTNHPRSPRDPGVPPAAVRPDPPRDGLRGRRLRRQGLPGARAHRRRAHLPGLRVRRVRHVHLVRAAGRRRRRRGRPSSSSSSSSGCRGPGGGVWPASASGRRRRPGAQEDLCPGASHDGTGWFFFSPASRVPWKRTPPTPPPPPLRVDLTVFDITTVSFFKTRRERERFQKILKF